MSNPPYSYELYNAYNGMISPSTVHVRNTGLAQFFKRYLLQEAMSVFDWKMPDHWARNYFLSVLYVWGYVAVFDGGEFGVIPQHCGLGGYSVMYQPTKALIANPLLPAGLHDLTIGKDCEIIRLQPDYLGLYDIVDYYGDLMALCAETVGVNILNSKLSYIFASAGKASAESYKELYDRIAGGDPAVFPDKDLLDDQGRLTVQLLQQNVGQNFIADRVLDCMNTIRNQFLTAIGIPNANTDKRERLNQDEVNANNFETRANCMLWLDELKKSCRLARDMFPGLVLDVDWRRELKEVLTDENAVDLDRGTDRGGAYAVRQSGPSDRE